MIRSIAKDFRILSSVTILLSAIFIGGSWAIIDYLSLKHDSQSMHDRLFSDRENHLQERVKRAVDYIDYFRTQAEERLKLNIKDRTYEASDIAAGLVTKYQGKIKPDALHHIVRDSLRNIRYNNGRGYFFAINVNGIEELFADKPSLEGKDLTGLQDSNGQYVVKDMLALAGESGEGFYSYTWSKPDSDRKDNVKIAFVKHLPELDWVIGTGEYLEDVEQDLQQEVLNSLDAVYRDPEGINYLFAATWDGLVLLGPGKGQNMLEIQDANGSFVVKELIEKAKDGGGIVQYVMPRLEGERPAPKLSYVYGIPEWRWYVGTGEYIDNIDAAVLNLKDNYYRNLRIRFYYIAAITIAVLLLNLIILTLFTNKLQIQIRRFLEFFHQATDNPVTIDVSKLTHSEFRAIGTAANDMLDERNSALDELKNSEERFRALHDASFGGVIIHDKGQILDCNQGLSDITGYANEELIGMDGLRLIAPASLDQVLHNIKIGYEKRYEVEGVRKDGSVYPLSIKGKNVLYQGRDVRVIEFQDITTYKETETALRKSEERFRQVAMTNWVWETDSGGRYTYCSDNVTDTLGYTPQEMIGKKPFDFMPEQEADRNREIFTKIVTGRKHIIDLENWNITKSGSTVCLLTNGTPFFDNTGNLLGYRGGDKDITARKNAEKELAKYRDQLELLVDDRTRELKDAQSELIQRERLATLGELTATVSHELRNPLGTIQSALFSIEDSLERNEPHQATRSLELAERSIDRCVSIMEDLNDYTRVKELDLSRAAIDDWLKTVFEEQAIPEEVICELALSSGIEALFDQEKLRQVVINVITNAVHALQDSRSNRKSLRISTHILDDKYEIRFCDNGIGMSEETKDKIFEPLYSTKGFGVGLGMVIVKNIVERHHGEINIESKAGEGTTITLRLPVNFPEERKI